MSAKFIVLLSLLGILFSCTEKTVATSNTNDQLKYAKLLLIAHSDSLTRIEIRNPQSNKIEAKFVLHRKNYNGKLPDGYQAIEIPVKQIAVFSSSYIGMLDAINATSCIRATTEAKYIANKTILQKIAKKEILTSGYEHALSPEAYVKNKIPLIIFSGFGQPFSNQDKLAQLNISCLPNYDWQESEPLGKAEWIKLFGALTDKWDEATAYFEQVEKSYFELKAKAAKLKPAKALVGSLNGTVWNAPAGESFMARLLKESGIAYCFSNTKGTGSLSLSLEEVYKTQKGNLLWIDAEARTKQELIQTNPRLQYFDAFQHGKIFSYMHNPNYFWEMNSLNPHWLLEDYIAIQSGKNLDKLHFYRLLK